MKYAFFMYFLWLSLAACLLAAPPAEPQLLLRPEVRPSCTPKLRFVSRAGRARQNVQSQAQPRAQPSRS